MAGSVITACAPYVNAGLLGSRFIGDCDIEAEDGTVSISGRRMPVWLVLVRAACFVLAVPMFMALLSSASAVTDRYDGWYWVVLIAAFLTVAVALGIGGGQAWARRRAPVEVIRWTASEATSPRLGHDATGPGLSFGGWEVVRLRAPVRGNGKHAMLTLRTSPAYSDALIRILSGQPSA